MKILWGTFKKFQNGWVILVQEQFIAGVILMKFCRPDEENTAFTAVGRE